MDFTRSWWGRSKRLVGREEGKTLQISPGERCRYFRTSYWNGIVRLFFTFFLIITCIMYIRCFRWCLTPRTTNKTRLRRTRAERALQIVSSTSRSSWASGNIRKFRGCRVQVPDESSMLFRSSSQSWLDVGGKGLGGWWWSIWKATLSPFIKGNKFLDTGHCNTNSTWKGRYWGAGE